MWVGGSYKYPLPMNTQRQWQHAQGLHSSKPGGIPVLRRESGHVLHCPTKKLLPVDNHLRRKKLIFSSGVSAYKKAGPRPSRGRPTQNELGANFGGVLSHTALSRHCFTFLISWLYAIVSRLYFYVLCVYTCMCVCDSHIFFCFFFPLFISLLCSILTFLFVYFLIGLCVF